MSDYPERISISPVHRQKHDDDFYLVDRKAFPGKGTEYVRADRIEELEAKLAKRESEIMRKRFGNRMETSMVNIKFKRSGSLGAAAKNAKLKGRKA